MATDAYRILSLEAKDLYDAMNPADGRAAGYNIKDKENNLKFKKFINTLDMSLDTMKLEEAYEKETRRKNFGFTVKRKKYTLNVINVTFNYSYKEFNKVGKNTFVRAGYAFSDLVLEDGVCVRDGKLLAIQTNIDINNPAPADILGDSFCCENGQYFASKIKSLMDRADLREWLYANGFKCGDMYYRRYKRSAGSARVGKCLFCNELLLPRMKKWDMCGLDVKDGDEIDLAAYESYISLPMSSSIGTITLQPENFLIISDCESEFQDNVVAVWNEDNTLQATEKIATIKNSLFDGQSLGDASLFTEDFEGKGMLLLRNQFFKTAMFNTNLQEWFTDHNITDVSQLNGFTLAEDLSQIKIITTPSSVKYMKFGKAEDWLKNINSTFSVVKYEKPQKRWDGSGRYCKSHYQLINTLQLTYEEMEQLLQPSLDYIAKLRSDPDVLRYHIKYNYDNEEGCTSLKTKNDIVFKMLGVNNKFAQTKIYNDFKNDLVRSCVAELKMGRILIKGNYSTLFGNGLEMLQHAIGEFNGESILGVGNIYCKNFAFDQLLLATRSPHINSGNVLLVNNVFNPDIEKYFNLTKEIVCVNAINENLQQKLNGCDYDSDTMLITDNEILINAAKRNYDLFKVPTNFVESVKRKRFYNTQHQADLDISTSVNKIGEIVNESQRLNSLMWDRMNNGATYEDCKELYYDICSLAVLSGIEIDRAKKEFTISSQAVLNKLKEKYKISVDGKTVKPKFFKNITMGNGYKLPPNTSYEYFDTPMDYLQRIIASHNFRQARMYKKDIIPFMDIVKKPDTMLDQGYYYRRKNEVVNIIRDSKAELKRIFIEYDNKTRDEKNIVLQIAEEIREKCVEDIDKATNNKATMYYVLREIDKKEFQDVARYMFVVCFAKPSETFFQLIEESKEPLYKLVECEDGDIQLYDYKFKKVVVERQNYREIA